MECKHRIKFTAKTAIFEDNLGPTRVKFLDRFYGELPANERRTVDEMYGVRGCDYRCEEPT
jgi:hypothetical protein